MAAPRVAVPAALAATLPVTRGWFGARPPRYREREHDLHRCCLRGAKNTGIGCAAVVFEPWV